LSPVQLEARVSPAAITDGRVRLSVGAGYLAGVVLTGVLPSPESVEAGPERVVFTFRAAAGNAPVTVRFNFEAHSFFRLRGRIAVAGDAPVEIATLVYP
jgi:hypothetical protein